MNEEGERREDMEKGNPRISKAALFSSPFLLSDKGITTEREREREEVNGDLIGWLHRLGSGNGN